jgi:hypothetical protein
MCRPKKKKHNVALHTASNFLKKFLIPELHAVAVSFGQDELEAHVFFVHFVLRLLKIEEKNV